MVSPGPTHNAERLLAILVKRLDKPGTWENPEALPGILEQAVKLAESLSTIETLRTETQSLAVRVQKAEAVATAALNASAEGKSAFQHLAMQNAVKKVG